MSNNVTLLLRTNRSHFKYQRNHFVALLLSSISNANYANAVEKVFVGGTEDNLNAFCIVERVQDKYLLLTASVQKDYILSWFHTEMETGI